MMSKTLVACFSAEAGTTMKVAKRLADAIGADLFEIVPEEPYTPADLNWKNPLARCNREKFGKKEVPVRGTVPNMEEYDTLFVGFPIWYYGAPNVIQTFLKSYDLSGKKIAAFATSGGSGIGKTAEKLRPYVGSGKIADARVFAASVSTEELKVWAEKI